MMRLTRQSEIAISILALCARPGTNLPVTTHMAAGHAGTTKDHAAQIVGKLVRTGYLASERGRAGGIRLARTAGRINLGEVLRLMETSPDYGPSGGSGGGNPAEAFGALQRAALDSFLAIFDDLHHSRSDRRSRQQPDSVS